MRVPTLISILLALLVSACDLQQQVEIDLPEYEPELLVESYLIPGSPYFVILSRTTGFFDTLSLDFVPGAEIVIEHNDQVDTLYELDAFLVDLLLGVGDSAGLLDQVIGDQPALYASVRFEGALPDIRLVPEDYVSPFTLRVQTAEGETLSATTRIPQPIPIAYQEARFNADGQALVLTAVEDPADQVNFYRRIFQARNPEVDSISGDTTWISELEQDFTLDDGITNGQTIEFGTGFDYAVGDTLIASVYHVTEDYFRFIDTRDAAFAASLSPFAQPAIIYTNIEGGQGIFTGMTLDQDTLIVPAQ